MMKKLIAMMALGLAFSMNVFAADASCDVETNAILNEHGASVACTISELREACKKTDYKSTSGYCGMVFCNLTTGLEEKLNGTLTGKECSSEALAHACYQVEYKSPRCVDACNAGTIGSEVGYCQKIKADGITSAE